jgi:hypothetical protein
VPGDARMQTTLQVRWLSRSISTLAPETRTHSTSSDKQVIITCTGYIEFTKVSSLKASHNIFFIVRVHRYPFVAPTTRIRKRSFQVERTSCFEHGTEDEGDK